MTVEELQKVKELLHQELEERDRAKKLQPMQYWPLILALVAVCLASCGTTGTFTINPDGSVTVTEAVVVIRNEK